MILHIDLDCFFVAAARIRDKSLIGKNVAVIGGGLNEDFGEVYDEKDREKGIVLSVSYEARKYGVKSAMPLKQAKVLCKNLVTAKADHEFYKTLSNKLYKFLYTFTPDIEKYSIDEFFLDLSGISARNNALEFAKFLQSEILDKFSLPASIGISDAKFIAKLTTDLAKPFGIKMIKKDDKILNNIDISKFPGVGKSVLKSLNKFGIFTLGDVKDSKFIFKKLGKNGIKLYQNITGEGNNTLEINQQRKSFSHGRTFKAINDRNEVKRRILILCRYLCYDIYKFGQNPTKFELKIKYLDRNTITRTLTYKDKFYEALLHKIMDELFKRCDEFKDKSIIYIGVGASAFVKNLEKNLFSDMKKSDIKIDKAVQVIRQKYGVNSLLFAKEIKTKK
ncbi:DNA polymerase IV [Campylobacter ureolyticus]|uniref:DNA polymerase IV n=1 Tax=Campylobacter ureolyticus TaxID=827 RepID=A0A9Q4PTZ5_9BACT|nr:DNA polymerase IV [Campylobacter ureolyticus]MCZ6160329.1 DNA polymerase IV [Campylobacter ureolyticus]MCZ6164061.1 DNA polymerase IV [Campylobacter ureolyticus]MCZ6166031.1 DNA polymerase IV [Campylobacter ureolyticus]MCZ6167518.1 DNA polymerase IV [Campylobacter ureolyticus]